jgi:hypothetical protein
MKTLLQFSLYLFQWLLCANSVIGKWKTIDDETGKKSVVEIYERSGKSMAKL